MLVTRIVLISLVLVLVGCGSMFPAYHAGGQASHALGSVIGAADWCISQGVYQQDVAQPLLDAMNRAGNVAKFSKDIAYQGYEETVKIAETQSPGQFCGTLKERVSAMVQLLDQHYYAAAEFHGAKADEWSAAMSRVGTYGPPPAPVVVVQPSGGPTYQAPRQSSTEHVLWRDGKIVSCTRTSSGVSVCQ
jgi:hypothetical protein